MLTKVLPAPDVHMSVVLAQMVEPALVHDEDPTGNDRSPVETEGQGKVSTFINVNKEL